MNRNLQEQHISLPNRIFNTINYMNKLLLGGIALLISGYAAAQGTTEDYNRAYSLRKAFNAKQVYYSQVYPTWNENGKFFWYVRNTPDGPVYVKVDAKSNNEAHCLIKRSWQRLLPGKPGKR